MKQIRKRLTYANVMSSIAVFLVLGGGAAIAAKSVLPKNSVGPKQLKKNAVTTAKIKKNAVSAAKIKKGAVTAAKIKDGAVTGAKVNLGTLGTVPSANHATTADTATNWSRYFTSGIVKATAGQDVQIFSVGPFTAIGHCKDLGGGSIEAWTTLQTTQVGSSMSAHNDYYYEADFNPGTEAELGNSISNSSAYSNDYGYPYYYNGFTASSADGKTMISGLAASAVFYHGAQCAFWAHGTNNA